MNIDYTIEFINLLIVYKTTHDQKLPHKFILTTPQQNKIQYINRCLRQRICIDYFYAEENMLKLHLNSFSNAKRKTYEIHKTKKKYCYK